MMRKYAIAMFLTALSALSFQSAALGSDLPVAVLEKLQGVQADFILVNIFSPVCADCGKEVAEINRVLREANESLPSHVSALGISIYQRKKNNAYFREHFNPQFELWTPAPSIQAELIQGPPLPGIILLNARRETIFRWTGLTTASEILAKIKLKGENVL